MKPVSIMLSPLRNVRALAVGWGLRANGVRLLCVPSLVDPALGPLSLAASGDAWDLHGAFNARDVRSIWCHRPQVPAIPADVAIGELGFVSGEWLALQKNLFGLATHAIDALWVNDPRHALEAENVLMQLGAAHRAGIGFPDTLVSNDPARVRAFIARHGRVVLRSFLARNDSKVPGQRLRRPAVTLIDDIDVVDDATIARCPGIYQRQVEKVCDLRAVVIGERLFCVRIDNDSPYVRGEEPLHTLPELIAQPYELPPVYQERLVALMRELGLVYGSIGLMLDCEGCLHFTGVDLAADGLQVEELVPELPLLQSLCAMLAQGRADYRVDLCADVTLAQWRDSGRGERLVRDAAAEPESASV